jgi:hypothetical protein
MSDIGADKLVKVFLKMRDELQQMEREHEEKVAELRSYMEVIEAEMLNVCRETGADSLKTSYGTIIKSTKTRYWTSDWESMYRFIEDHKAFDLLERRVHQTNMKAWIEDNPDFLPQGLNAESRHTVTVRRSK